MLRIRSFLLTAYIVLIPKLPWFDVPHVYRFAVVNRVTDCDWRAEL